MHGAKEDGVWDAVQSEFPYKELVQSLRVFATPCN